MSIITILAVILLGYLLGSIPVGYLVVLATRGVDVRTVGSGRTGSTNAMRAAGPAAFVLTGLGDGIKAALAVFIAQGIAGATPEVGVLAGLGAVAGHNWSVFMGFRGGAGTGPNIGAAMMFWPLSGLWLIALVPFGLVVVGYASVASLLVAIAVPVTFALRAAAGLAPWAYFWYGIGSAALVILALIPNIRRLLTGTEPRVSQRAAAAQSN